MMEIQLLWYSGVIEMTVFFFILLILKFLIYTMRLIVQ